MRSKISLASQTCLALVGALCLGSVLPAEAQTIRGVIRDSETAAPVALAYIGLLEPGQELVAAALADGEGRFTLDAPAAGSYFLTVERMGYRTVMDGLFELGEDGVVELQVGMRATAIPLGGLVVEVEGSYGDLRTVGFYERKEDGHGHFLERKDLELADRLTDALRRIPRLRVETVLPNIVGMSGLLNPAVFIGRAGSECSPALYLDGQLVVPGSFAGGGVPSRPDDFVSPAEVEAVEIYTGPAGTPVLFEATSGCGAIVIWTRLR